MTADQAHRTRLGPIARQAMLERGLWPDFSPAANREAASLQAPRAVAAARDLRGLPWCSIDNDDSRDLDQITVAESLAGGRTRILVAIADVDAAIAPARAIDEHARHNTTSVYTAAVIFPMLPERLSTDLTSLVQDQDRLAVVVDMVVDGNGAVLEGTLQRALVRNRAKLAYDAVAAWLDGQAAAPLPVAAVQSLAENLRLQDAVAEQLRARRFQDGALDLETIEPRAVYDGDAIRDLRVERKNRARMLIEDFMIAANGVTARFLKGRRVPSLRRVVRSPERWDKIVALVAAYGETLPPQPDCCSLGQFLARQRERDPLRFPDLSLTIVKLLGAGEYVVEQPDDDPIGHFGLAVRNYAHSPAPTRRYPDLVTQRLVKAALAGERAAHDPTQLAELAHHCTDMEDAADKVERQVRKSAAALLLAPRVGESFDAIVTGASAKGTWVRLLAPPAEGKLVRGFEHADVGDRVHVRLVATDVARGFIDFARLS
ncbi:MAG: RNB domain-containing ribonuclease [Planctomycetota bacterium]